MKPKPPLPFAARVARWWVARFADLPGRIALRAQGLASLRAPAGTVICVEEGSVWLTQCDDLHDHVLRAGHRFVLNGRGLTAVQAFEPAVVRLQARP
jgi:hypothetical protein